MKITFTRQEVAGQPVKCYFGSSTSSMNGSGSTGTLVRADELPTAVGSVNFAVVVHCVAGEAVNNYSSVVPRVAADLSLTSVFELVPSSQATVKPLHDPTQTNVMQQAIRARLTMASDGRIDTMVDLKSTPVPLSYEVMLIVQGRETTVGHLSCPAVLGTSSWGIGGSAFIKPPSTATTKKAGDTVDVATVVFRPDPAEAIDTTDVTDYWDGTIELDQVPIVKGWH